MGLAFPTDAEAERATLAGIFRHGGDAFVDVDGVLDASSFSRPTHQVIYKCFEDFYADGVEKKIDIPSFLSVARKLGLADKVDIPYLGALRDYPVELPTVAREAAKIFKLTTARELDQHLAESRQRLHEISGNESLNEILALAENPIFDFTSKLNGAGEGPIHIADGGRAWLENVLANPADTIGIPSPFAKYNALIGGGFRRKSISIIGARPKQGKTIFCDNVCLHVAGKLGIPVYNADTEMTQEEHLARILAHATNIDSLKIEMGRVSPAQADALRRAMDWLETIPYYYESVIDKTFEEQIASMRRWVIKRVGVDGDGRRNPALVVYDYLQLTDPGGFHGDFKEYQLLGFQMVALHRLSARCDVPILSMLQVNREGIDKETTAVAAGSDRIIWKCANFSILKKKTEEEVAEHPDAGRLKLINLIARHGPGGLLGDYINVGFDGATSRMYEGKTRYELERTRGQDRGKIETDIGDEETFTL